MEEQQRQAKESIIDRILINQRSGQLWQRRKPEKQA